MTERTELPVEASARLDHFLREALPHLSRRHLRRLLEQGNIQVNGRRSKKGHQVVAGDVVSVDRDIAQATRLRPQPELALPILYEDETLIAIDKPCSVPSVAQRATDLGTAANFVLAHCPGNADLGKSTMEAGIVHRLDTATSGVLLAAKSDGALRQVRQQFREHTVEKTYRLIVAGQVSGKNASGEGAISTPLRNRPGRPDLVEVADEGVAKSRPAETRYKVIGTTETTTHLEACIHTGARHQIRAHFASIGHPLVGDVTYGSCHAAPRLMLHAWRVSLVHPGSGVKTTIEAPLPPELRI